MCFTNHSRLQPVCVHVGQILPDDTVYLALAEGEQLNIHSRGYDRLADWDPETDNCHTLQVQHGLVGVQSNCPLLLHLVLQLKDGLF